MNKKKGLALHWQIIIGLFLGVVWAVISISFNLQGFTLDWINPFGDIFINLLKLIAVPLVLFSIIGGVAGIGDPEKLGRMGFKTISLYLGTTVIAVTLGLGLVNTLQPGKLIDEESRIDNRIVYELWAKENKVKVYDGKSILSDSKYTDRIKNIAQLNGSSEHDEVLKQKIQIVKSRKEKGPLQFLVDMVPSNIFSALSGGTDMLKVIFFAIFFGISLLLIPNKNSDPVLAVVNGVNEVFIKMVELIMIASPYFVFALMAGIVTKLAGDNVSKVVEIFKGLSWYSLVVVLGLLLMIFAVYPLVLRLFLGRQFNYKNFFEGINESQTLAFSTSSSAATLPVTMECVEDNLGVDKRVTSFVLPIGATVNMDGTSMYQAIAVIFLAHFHDVDLNLAQQLTIVLTATLASIGSAAVPGAGLVMLMIVLETVGLDSSWIAIILPVDRILDMLRTVVNVTGDATVSSIINKTEKFS
jgi:Na+/H+-dicarboxylate symporter